jgi:competence protein ComGC
MKAVKITLLVIGLLLAIFVAGCQETQAYKAQGCPNATIKFVPTGTGFYRLDSESIQYTP